MVLVSAVIFNGLLQRYFQQLGVLEQVFCQLQAFCKVEAVCDTLIGGEAQRQNVPRLGGAVGHDPELLPENAHGDHNAVGTIVVEVMITAGALDAAQIGEHGEWDWADGRWYR